MIGAHGRGAVASVGSYAVAVEGGVGSGGGLGLCLRQSYICVVSDDGEAIYFHIGGSGLKKDAFPAVEGNDGCLAGVGLVGDPGGGCAGDSYVEDGA